jgi:hypothetical protein
MLHMQAWPLTVLDVTNMWHWNGVSSSACMAAWGATLMQLIADGTALPLAAAAEGGSAAKHTSGVSQVPQQQQQQQQHNGSDFCPAAADAAGAGGGLSSGSTLGNTPQLGQPNMSRTAAGATQLGRQQQSSSSSSSSRDWVSCTGQLQQLQLRGLLVDNPSRCRTHGSSECSCRVSVGAN